MEYTCIVYRETLPLKSPKRDSSSKFDYFFKKKKSALYSISHSCMFLLNLRVKVITLLEKPSSNIVKYIITFLKYSFHKGVWTTAGINIQCSTMELPRNDTTDFLTFIYVTMLPAFCINNYCKYVWLLKNDVIFYSGNSLKIVNKYTSYCCIIAHDGLSGKGVNISIYIQTCWWDPL